MDGATINNPDRSQLEARILEAADSVPLLELGWLESQELDHFIGTWLDLASFYASHTDTVIGLEAIREYDSFIRLLRRIMCDGTEDAQRRKLAEEHLLELEAALGEVIKEAVTNLRS